MKSCFDALCLHVAEYEHLETILGIMSVNIAKWNGMLKKT